MSGWTPWSPWRIIPGSGQTLSLTSGTQGTFTNKVGAQTRAFAIRLAPAATAYMGTITVSNAGTVATASTDYPIGSSDPPQVIGCSPNDKVSVFQASGSAGTAQMVELTH